MRAAIADADGAPESATEPVRVVIIDDSAVARAVLSGMCGDDPAIRVVGTFATSQAAIAFLTQARADIILLDLDMPGIDGLTALPDLLAVGKGARVLVVSARAGEGAAATVQALALGAADTLAKPEPGAAIREFAALLSERITRLAAMASDPAPAREAPAVALPRLQGFAIVAIAASTGGIHALSGMLRCIPADMTAPMLVTQHLPASFMPYFAAQLAVLSGRPCTVASEGAPLLPGRIVIAPGDAHLGIVANGRGGYAMRLSRERAASGCMPSADPMFASVGAAFGGGALAVVLSGMGRDGALGAASLLAAGGQLVAQDAASSVVWGMPGAVSDIAHAVAAPAMIGHAIAMAFGR